MDSFIKALRSYKRDQYQDEVQFQEITQDYSNLAKKELNTLMSTLTECLVKKEEGRCHWNSRNHFSHSISKGYKGWDSSTMEKLGRLHTKDFLMNDMDRCGTLKDVFQKELRSKGINNIVLWCEREPNEKDVLVVEMKIDVFIK